MFQVGERIGDYEIMHVLGAGGMGQVYKVRNTLSDRVEAMKVLLPGLVGDTGLADRFLREIKVQASLIHKNIAQLYTAQRHGDQILMLLEFVDGSTLESLMKQGALNTGATIKIFVQVLDALSFAHGRGVVHRDIKPANIMVTPDGTAKLMDFGIARASAERRLTQTGRTLGSLYYMSPEQIRGADDIDGRSDLYSLGITLYEAATGSRPFEGDSDFTIMAAHLQQPPIPPVDRDPCLPREFSDVILAALEKDRNQRFQSAGAFKSALGHLNVGSAAAVPTSHTATLVSVAPPTPQPAQRLATVPMVQPLAPAQSYVPPPPVSPLPPVLPRKSNAGLFMALGAVAFMAIAGLGAWQYPKIFGQKTVVDEAKTPDPKPVDPQPGGAGPVKPDDPPSKIQPDRPKPDNPPTDRKSPPVEPKQKTEVAGKLPAPQPPPSPDPAPNRPEPGGGGAAQSPGKQFQEPQVDPAVARELEALRQHYNQLAVRLTGCKEGMASLEAQQQRMGLGLRGDIKEAARNADGKLHEAITAMRNKDVETARTNLEAAERMIDFVGKVVGR